MMMCGSGSDSGSIYGGVATLRPQTSSDWNVGDQPSSAQASTGRTDGGTVRDGGGALKMFPRSVTGVGRVR